MTTERSLTRLLPFLVLGGVALGAVVFRAPGITTSATFIDEGVRIAAALPISQGSPPYAEVSPLGAPGAIFFNALILAFFGPSLVAVRVAYLAVSVMSLLLVFYIAERTWGKVAGLVAALLFALSPLEVFYSYHAMSEPLMVLFVLGALAAVVTGASSAATSWFALAGALTFAAALVKQPGILVAIPVVVALGLELLGSGDRKLVARRLTVYLGGLAAMFVACAVVLWIAAGSAQWLEQMVGSRVFRQARPSGWSDFVTEYLIRRGFMVLGLCGLVLPPRAGLRANVLRGGAVVVTVFTLLLPLTYGFGGFSHYLLILEPWWIILAGGAAHWLVETARRELRARSSGSLVRRSAGVVIVALVSASGAAQARAALEASATNADWFTTLSEERAVAARLEDAEGVLVLANPIYYFHSGRRPPTVPMHYFLVFHLRFFQGEALERMLLEGLSGAEMLLVDAQRWKIVEPVLESSPEAPELRLAAASDGSWPRLYEIHRDGEGVLRELSNR